MCSTPSDARFEAGGARNINESVRDGTTELGFFTAEFEPGMLTCMSQAIVDPAELRRFANNLRLFSSELQNRMSVLQGQAAGLGQSWRDQEQEKFVQEFDQTMLVLRRFMESADQHVPFLLRKAERVEEYLQQR